MSSPQKRSWTHRVTDRIGRFFSKKKRTELLVPVKNQSNESYAGTKTLKSINPVSKLENSADPNNSEKHKPRNTFSTSLVPLPATYNNNSLSSSCPLNETYDPDDTDLINIFHDASAMRKVYLLKEKVGTGSFGEVRKAIHKPTGEIIAIKIINRESVNVQTELYRIRRELLALRSLDHPNVVKCYHSLHSESHTFIVMEYCDGGDLFDFISKNKVIKESEAKRLFRQIVSAVEYIHTKGICHRDLKPENILLDSVGNAKLIDFNLCKSMELTPFKSRKLLTTHCGTIEYVAPEVISGLPYDGVFSDSWSLGVLLYTILCGCFPFQVVENIKKADYDFPRNISRQSKKLIKNILKVCPNQRLTPSEILNHPWLKSSQHGDGQDYSNYSTVKAVKRNRNLDEECLLITACLMGQTKEEVLNSIRHYKKWSSPSWSTYLIVLRKKNILSHEQLQNWKSEQRLRGSYLDQKSIMVEESNQNNKSLNEGQGDF